MTALEDSEAEKKAWRDNLSTAVPVIAIRKVPNIGMFIGCVAMNYT